MKMAFDATNLRRAIKAGLEPAIFQMLAKEHGITFDSAIAEQHFMLPEHLMAMDAPNGGPPQAVLSSQPNEGVPWYLTNWMDPRTVQFLVTPMMAAVIAGEVGKGTWVTKTATFKTAEATGETSSYGDYSMSGSTDVNYNFPYRQNYLGQAFLQYGDLEVATAAEAKIDLPGDKQSSNALALSKLLNFIYNYGVAGLQNYGLLNDPTLPPPITPTYSWLTSSSATALTIYQDFVRLWVQLQIQAPGLVRRETPMVAAMSPEQSGALAQVTQYNTNSVEMLLKQNFKNLRIETAPEYNTSSGQLVQLIVENVENQPTVECAYSTKMHSHTPVRNVSSYMAKRTVGGYGAYWYRPFLCASMLG